MAYQGFAGLRSIHDLYEKLAKDYQRVLDNKGDAYCAFDFFVTAHHMVDWLHPNNRRHQREFEESEVLLQLCSHIANGAKHFTATAKKHQSVTSVENKNVANYGYQVEKGVIELGYVERCLYVELDGDAKSRYGKSMRAEVLAWEILEFWRQELYPQ